MSQAPHKPRWEYIAVMVYAVLLSVLLLKHEPWLDEAQAWLIARDASIVELFSRTLRYEGTPFLWHLALMLPAKLGFPYISLNVISALLAVTGVYLVVVYSPFPKIIRLLYPFTYFVFYQYAVVARNYVLLPIILSAIAIIYRERRKRICLFTALLILLGAVSLHGFLMALGLAAVEGVEALKNWKKLEGTEKASYLKSLAMFGAFSALTVLILWPPGDSASLLGFRFNPADYLRVSAGVAYEFLSGYKYSSALILAVLLWWFWHTRTLLTYLATTLPILALFALTWVYPHHTGVMFLALFFNLWLSFEAHPAKDWKNKPRLVALTALLFLFSFHIYWAASAFKYDFFEKYSASRDVANYLKATHLEGRKIAAIGNRVVAILPYFDTNVFANFNSGQKPCYWIWSKSYNPHIWSYRDVEAYSVYDKLQSAAKDNPDLIVVSIFEQGNLAETAVPGYKLEKVFQGRVYWRDKAGGHESFAILARDADGARTID